MTRGGADVAVAGAMPHRERAPALRRHAAWWLAALALLALPYLPGLASDFARSLLTQMGIAAVFALSYNVLFGQTGLLSFGHAVYFGLGGYAALHLLRFINQGLPVPLPFVPIAGALGGLLFGILFGAVTTRRAGTIFALISLGVGELVYAATFMLPGLFGGEEGITASRTRAPLLLGIDFGSQLSMYYLVVAWGLLAAVLMYAFARTPVGRLCNAVRDNPERVEFVGYDPQRIRFIAFAVAGLFAGLAGGLSAINYEIVSADAVGAQRSGTVLVMTYIGGARHFAGPVLGAITITWLQIGLSGYTTAWLLYLGLFFIAVILFVPGGLAGLLLMHVPLVKAPGFVRLLGTYALATIPAVIATAGLVVLIEMSYRLATQPELGTRMRLLGIPVDASTAASWTGALAAVILGFVAFRATWPTVAAAFERVQAASPSRSRLPPS